MSRDKFQVVTSTLALTNNLSTKTLIVEVRASLRPTQIKATLFQGYQLPLGSALESE